MECGGEVPPLNLNATGRGAVGPAPPAGLQSPWGTQDTSERQRIEQGQQETRAEGARVEPAVFLSSLFDSSGIPRRDWVTDGHDV